MQPDWPHPVDPLAPFDDGHWRLRAPGKRPQGPMRLGVWKQGPVPAPPSVEDLARVTLDIEPAAGADALDLVLGHHADVLDLTDAGQRHLAVTAVAAFGFAQVCGRTHTAFARWVRQRPLPSVAERAAFRAVDRGPLAPWRIRELGATWQIDDLLHVGAPPRVQVPRPAWIHAPPEPGALLWARLVPTDVGWVASVPIVVPDHPEHALDDWLADEAAAARTVLPGITRIDLLRVRGHVLLRRSAGSFARP